MTGTGQVEEFCLSVPVALFLNHVNVVLIQNINWKKTKVR